MECVTSRSDSKMRDWNPGQEARGHADVEIFNPFWATFFFFGILFTFFVAYQHNNHANNVILCFFPTSVEKFCVGQLLSRDETAEINTVTVIVLRKKKKCIFYSQFIC